MACRWFLLHAPLVVMVRLLWTYRNRGQVERAMEIAKCRARGQPLLGRVKWSSANPCDRPAHATPSPPGCNRRARSSLQSKRRNINAADVNPLKM